jgi:hypothetical protein
MTRLTGTRIFIGWEFLQERNDQKKRADSTPKPAGVYSEKRGPIRVDTGPEKYPENDLK